MLPSGKTELLPVSSHSPGGALERGDQIGDCLIEDLVGEGGSAYVYRARHIRLDVLRAIKLLKRSAVADSGLRARFLREAKISAHLHHPRIAGVHNVAEDQGRLYIEMEMVQGLSLRRLLEKSSPLPFSVALSIAIQAAEGLRYAHNVPLPGGLASGIVHRDIKPENILVLPEGEVKIVDFGLAKSASIPGETAEGAVLGTFHYMPVEQMEGAVLDARADIYSLCVVFYEMITGRLPFNGATYASLSRSIRSNDYTPPKRLNPAVPSSVSAVLAKGLSARVEDRFPTADALCAALEKIGKSLPAANARSVGQFLGGRFHGEKASVGRRWVPVAAFSALTVAGTLAYFMRQPLPAAVDSVPGAPVELPMVEKGLEFQNPGEVAPEPATPVLPLAGPESRPQRPVTRPRDPMERAREIFENLKTGDAEKQLQEWLGTGGEPSRIAAAYYIARLQEKKVDEGRNEFRDSAIACWKTFIKNYSRDAAQRALVQDAKERLLPLIDGP